MSRLQHIFDIYFVECRIWYHLARYVSKFCVSYGKLKGPRFREVCHYHRNKKYSPLHERLKRRDNFLKQKNFSASRTLDSFQSPDLLPKRIPVSNFPANPFPRPWSALPCGSIKNKKPPRDQLLKEQMFSPLH